MTKFTLRALLAALGLATAIVVFGLDAPRLRGQALAAAPTFEVVSVKPNKTGTNQVMIGNQPGGRFVATNVALRMLVRQAYQVQDFQLVGGPDWLGTDRFDIVAKAPDGEPPPQPLIAAQRNGPPSRQQLMLRAMLADRFKLAVHTEQRELQIYALVLARPDGKLGPKLRPSTTDCAAEARGRAGAPLAFPAPNEPMRCGMRMGPGSLVAGATGLTQLATSLSNSVQRVVVDRTGLTGTFDFDLTWTPEQIAQRPVDAPAGVPAVDPNGPSLFTAIQEQLGLKLESTKGPVDVLVIDRAEPPTPD